jgi:hypothetical protein
VTLADIKLFVASAQIVRSTNEALREAGLDRYERFVLWTGVSKGDTFTVRTTHVPAQTAYRTSDGVCVRVNGDALHRLNRWQYEHGETLAVQIHTHPEVAYHSNTDDTYPIVTELGGLSVVVPEFARNGLTGGGIVAYRLGRDGWDELSSTDTQAVLVMEA